MFCRERYIWNIIKDVGHVARIQDTPMSAFLHLRKIVKVKCSYQVLHFNITAMSPVEEQEQHNASRQNPLGNSLKSFSLVC